VSARLRLLRDCPRQLLPVPIRHNLNHTHLCTYYLNFLLPRHIWPNMPRKYAMLSQGRDSINVQVPVTTREFCALHCDLISHNACNNKDRRPIQFLDVKTRPLSLAEVLNTGRRDKRTVKDNFRRGLAFAPGEPYQRFHVKTERPARFALPARRHQVLQIEKPHGLTRGLYEHYFNGMPKVFKWLQDRSGQVGTSCSALILIIC
jgi:hypothetical protein